MDGAFGSLWSSLCICVCVCVCVCVQAGRGKGERRKQEGEGEGVKEAEQEMGEEEGRGSGEGGRGRKDSKIKLIMLLTCVLSCIHFRPTTNPTPHRNMINNTFLISSRVNISGESPPCTQRNCPFMMAARGRQSNDSMHASYTVSVYLILPVCVCPSREKGERGGREKSKSLACYSAASWWSHDYHIWSHDYHIQSHDYHIGHTYSHMTTTKEHDSHLTESRLTL